jgi:hypothetical protein
MVGALMLVGACSRAPEPEAEPQLVPVAPEVRVECQSTADSLGFAVPCPTALPVGSKPTLFEGGNCPGRSVWIGVGCGLASTGAFASIEFTRPAGGAPGHLVIEATPQPVSADEAVSFPVPPMGSVTLKSRGHLPAAGTTGEVFGVSEDSSTAFSGHTIVVWTADGHTYAAGIHGTDGASVKLNESVVGALEMVAPS